MDGDRIEQIYARAGRSLRLCLLSEGEGRGRVVEPHAIFTSRRGRRLFHCYQVGGFSEGGECAGWKNIERDHLASAEVLDAPFACRSEYRVPNPDRRLTGTQLGLRLAVANEVDEPDAAAHAGLSLTK